MKRIIIYILMLGMFCSCVDEEQYDDSPRGNFEALWRIFDEHYCFFSYKKAEYGLDWDAIYQKYAPQFSSQMSDSQMFEVMANMLSELRDGHVNIYSTFDVARNWSWHEDYPQNYSDSLMRIYMGTDYKIAAGLEYRTLDDNIGFVRYSSFLQRHRRG